MTNIISIYNLSKAFDGKKLFQNFNFTVKKNSVHALIGANGAGKTTLLRLLTGLYEPDEGKISVSGKHAMLLENDYLYEDKTGLENLKIFGLYFGYYVKDYKKYSDSLNITEHLLKRVSTYSKGMKRKLSILIVILINSEIIYLDEPTSGVDPLSRVEIRKIIQKLKEEGKTILITSHDLSEIEKSADYVTMIENGKVVFNEDIDNIKGTTLEELFIKEGVDYEVFLDDNVEIGEAWAGVHGIGDYEGLLSSTFYIVNPGSQDPEPDPSPNPRPGTDFSKSILIGSIKISGISNKIAAGKKIALKANISPANATNKTLV